MRAEGKCICTIGLLPNFFLSIRHFPDEEIKKKFHDLKHLPQKILQKEISCVFLHNQTTKCITNEDNIIQTIKRVL